MKFGPRVAGGGLCLLMACMTWSCTDSGSTPTEIAAENIDDRGDEVFIVDQTGKRWDVTHARDHYGMDPAGFQFGLGPFAIAPIIDPSFVHEGDQGYPADDRRFLVIGATINGVTRAYEQAVLYSVEIVDDDFSGTHVAVAY